MGYYKVLKDFPSRNGVKQYKAGSAVCLDSNSRTKALVEMGYIEAVQPSTDFEASIAEAVKKIDMVQGVNIKKLYQTYDATAYVVRVRTK